MKKFPSQRGALATVAVLTLMLAALFVVAEVPTVEAQQSGASEEEIEARVRAELQARLAQINQRLMERMQQLEGLRAGELEAAQRQLEELQVQEARIRELVEYNAQQAGDVQSRAAERAEREYAEAMRRAMASAEQAMQRARGFSTMRIRSGCDVFGDTVLDYAGDLGLSDEQQDAIREAQRATRREAIERNADIEVGEMDLEALYENDEPDLAAIRAKLQELAMLGVDNQVAGLQLRQQVRDILTTEQRQQLDDLRGDRDFNIVIAGPGNRWTVRNPGC